MSKYEQRVEALENNEKKKKRMFAVIIAALVLIFLGGMIIGAQNILNTEGVFDPYAITDTQPIKIDLPANQLISKLKASFDSADNPDTLRLSVYTDVEVPDDSICVESGDESLVTQLKYIKPKILDEIKEYYKIYEGKFGEDFSDKVISLDFEEQDIQGVECVQGKVNDEGKLVDYDSLFYTVKFPKTDFKNIESTALFDNFGMTVSGKIRDMFTEDIKEIASAENIRIQCKDFYITAQTDKLSGKIKNIWYIRGYSVKLSLSFKGDLENLGTQVISFDFYAKESHWYTWADLNLSAHTLSIKKGDVQAIQAYRTADDEVEVIWTSSNPEIAAVDEMGYVKGKATSKEPVTITATFDYRGNTYTDKCTVFVRKPVKEIKTTPKEIEIKVGETHQLSVKVSPKKATIQDVLWFTEDESIVTVDENGVVKAVSAGTTKAYAVSVDGYYRSSCTVTVTQ